MSEKLLPCPFCGGEARTFEYDGANQATCGGKHIDCAGTDVVAPVAMWNRRTPAPEGEACPTCNGVRPEFCSNAFHLASPVVPAPEGEVVAWVRPTELAELADPHHPRREIHIWGHRPWTGFVPLYASPVVPVGSGEAGVYTQADYEEAAALGERDGYEKAVQDIDLLTGGDGEYKATTHDGVIDMPVMKARIIQRFSSLRQLVVPVGVSREEIARALFERHWSAVSASPKWPGDDDGSYWLWLADAILAALRPADTGANHD